MGGACRRLSSSTPTGGATPRATWPPPRPTFPEELRRRAPSAYRTPRASRCYAEGRRPSTSCRIPVVTATACGSTCSSIHACRIVRNRDALVTSPRGWHGALAPRGHPSAPLHHEHCTMRFIGYACCFFFSYWRPPYHCQGPVCETPASAFALRHRLPCVCAVLKRAPAI
jgi:hypothetical protein